MFAIYAGSIAEGYIAGSGDGIVTALGNPASRKIWLFNAETMVIQQATVSLPSGHYIFIGLDVSKRYLVMVRDYKKELEPSCFDNVKPADDLTIEQQQTMWSSWQ